jgi:nicotinamide N-methyltransferase
LPDGSSRYDVLVLSDLLHFDTSHPALLASLSSLLAKSSTSRAYVGAGKYTSAAVCAQWVRLAGEKGLEMEEVIDEDEWKGTMGVIWSGKAMDRQELTERKRNCRLWVGRWVTNT